MCKVCKVRVCFVCVRGEFKCIGGVTTSCACIPFVSDPCYIHAATLKAKLTTTHPLHTHTHTHTHISTSDSARDRPETFYSCVSKVGQGAFSQVFCARHHPSDSLRAVKVLRNAREKTQKEYNVLKVREGRCGLSACLF